MVVVGVEPSNRITQALLRECDPDNPEPGRDIHVGELAAALVLEPWEGGSGIEPRGFIGDYGFVPPDGEVQALPGKPDVWFIPSQNSLRSQEFVRAMQGDGAAGIPIVDVTLENGELYGALGVFQVVQALAHLKSSGRSRALLSSGLVFGDGLSFMEVTV